LNAHLQQEVAMDWVPLRTGRPERLPCERTLFGSGSAWKGFRLEQRIDGRAVELVEGYTPSHLVVMNTGDAVRRDVCEAGKWTSARHATGEVMIIPAGIPIAMRRSGPAEFTVLSTPPEYLDAVAGHGGAGRGLEPRVVITNEPLLAQLVTALRDDLRAGSPTGALYGETLGSALAAQLLRAHGGARAAPQRARGGLSDGRLRKVLEYIDAHLAAPMSLADLARMVELGTYHFAHQFKQSVGISPHRHVLQRRIEWSKSLLRDTDLPLVDLALRCGFANQSHFAATFRRVTKATPAEYRRSRYTVGPGAAVAR
jgi:AraC family transcriptional regulator